jgi:asparagine synthase (glutamine-hydrolysing)
MCGILLHKKNNIKIDEFKSNLQRLSHRGPDYQDVHRHGNILLGHTRLSIIDLTNLGNQPMISDCLNYVISFNGEIYNYDQLKNELKSCGYSFKSNSDTEVLLNGYIEYGKAIIKKLDGIFSFIILDKERDQVFFVRDQFGVKPLYYYKSNSEFIISSESRVFDKYCDEDELTKILFLSHGYIPSPKVIFKDVKSLKPGHYGLLDNNQLIINQYYCIEDLFRSDNKTFNNRKLFSAVSKQTISDAKIGSFLSGGVDSSIITFIASKFKNNLETYSINFKDQDDEKKFQKIMIDLININNKEMDLSFQDFKNQYNKFITSMDQPTIDGFNTFFVSSLAKKNNAKVAFSGVGSDEIFYGYPTHKGYFKKTLLNLLNLIPRFILPNKLKKVDYLLLGNDYGYYLAQRGIFSIDEISKILSLDKKIIIQYLNNFVNDDLLKTSNLNFKDTMGYFELTKYMEGQLLKDTDVFGMSNSIEIRVPYLDKCLVEHVLSISSRYKLSSRINKKILIEKFINDIPKEIYQRRKKGFELPYKIWLKSLGLNSNSFPDPIYSSILKNVHWSKLWAINIMSIKYSK